MDKHTKQHDISSSSFRFRASDPSREPGSVRQTESSMPSVSAANSRNYNPTSQIVQWLAQVEPHEADRRSPCSPSTTTSASQPPQNNAEPVMTSAASVQQAIAAPAPPPPTKKFVYKKVRRGAMLGLGGSGGWIPASYVWVRVPAETTGPGMPSQPGRPGQPLSSSMHQDDSEYLRTQDESSPLVAPPNSEADA